MKLRLKGGVEKKDIKTPAFEDVGLITNVSQKPSRLIANCPMRFGQNNKLEYRFCEFIFIK